MMWCEQGEAARWGVVFMRRGDPHVKPPSSESTCMMRMGSRPCVSGWMKGRSGSDRSTHRAVAVSLSGANSLLVKPFTSPGTPSHDPFP